MPKAIQPDPILIEALGAEGDGVAQISGGRVYVPFALPGETITLKGPARPAGKDVFRGEVGSILKPSPERVEPVCAHFGVCGGCRLQHLNQTAMAKHKRGVLGQALARKGLEPGCLNETIAVPAQSRRRARFVYRRTRSGGILGFNRRNSHDILHLAMCPVLTPSLQALVPQLLDLANSLPALGKSADIQVAEADTGFDIVLLPKRRSEPGLAERERIADWAEEHDIARISWDDGGGALPVAARRPFLARFAGVAGVDVEIPVGAFLQPSARGESHLATLVTGAMEKSAPKARRIADLFAGCGALTFPVAVQTGAIVEAFEIDGEMTASIRRAASGGELRVIAETRDLFSNPISTKDLSAFDAVVFDPPKAGAAAQALQLAASSVAVVVAVSCSSSTLARDLRALVDGGYRLVSATPVDQFTWSGRLEAVAVLTR